MNFDGTFAQQLTVISTVEIYSISRRRSEMIPIKSLNVHKMQVFLFKRKKCEPEILVSFQKLLKLFG
jgi:hypothetical protein